MSKDLKKLAKKYNSLSASNKITVEAAIRGEVMDKWFSDRLQEMNILIDTSWFHLENLGIKVGNDDRLRLKGGVITEIPREEGKQKLKYARDFIADYFLLAEKYILNPSKAKQRMSFGENSDGWDEDDFLLGLIKRDRSNGFELFD